MVRGPYGPWRRLEDDEPPPSLGIYEHAPHLFKFAVLYHRMGRLGISPPVVRQMTPQQVGAFLGVGLLGTDATPTGPVRDVNRERFEWLAEIQEARDAGDEARAVDLEAHPPPPDVPQAPVAAPGRPNQGLPAPSGVPVAGEQLGPHVFHPPDLSAAPDTPGPVPDDGLVVFGPGEKMP